MTMKRRDLIKSLALLPLAGNFPIESPFAAPVGGINVPLNLQNKPMPELHRKAFVMDGHTHVMTRELLMGTDIGQRYPDGNQASPLKTIEEVDRQY